MKNLHQQKAIHTSQRGVVLIVALIFLLMLSIIGMSAIRSSGMQELMAGNIKDRNLAFQSAEASLRVAEELINTNAACANFTGLNGCFEDQNAIDPVSTWTAAEWAAGSREADITLAISNKPRYVIERLPATDSPVSASAGFSVEFNSDSPSATGTVRAYRITSTGYGGTGASEVILQSTYRHQDP